MNSIVDWFDWAIMVLKAIFHFDSAYIFFFSLVEQPVSLEFFKENKKGQFTQEFREVNILNSSVTQVHNIGDHIKHQHNTNTGHGESYLESRVLARAHS